MREYSVGYTIHNRVDLIVPILKSIAKCFPKECEVIFHFDACTDQSFNIFQRNKFLLDPRKIVVLQNDQDLFEIKSNNLLIDTFTKDVLVIFQDDMICVDEEICERADQIIDQYGSSLGLLGSRDGYEIENGKRTKFVKNEWSVSSTPGQIISKDEWLERTFINRGPIFLTRDTIKKLHGFSEEFYPQTYDDNDFCCRAKFHYQLKNVVMFSKIVEDQKGKTSKLNYSMLYRLNSKLFFNKWRTFIGYSKPRHFYGYIARPILNVFSHQENIRKMLIFKHKFGPGVFWRKIRAFLLKNF